MPPLELEIPTNLPKDGLCGTGARHRTRRIALVTSKGSVEHVAAEPLAIGGRRNQHFCHTAELVLKPLPNAICRARRQVNTVATRCARGCLSCTTVTQRRIRRRHTEANERHDATALPAAAHYMSKGRAPSCAGRAWPIDGERTWRTFSPLFGAKFFSTYSSSYLG
jgi:hypothetical protein